MYIFLKVLLVHSLSFFKKKKQKHTLKHEFKNKVWTENQRKNQAAVLEIPLFTRFDTSVYMNKDLVAGFLQV